MALHGLQKLIYPGVFYYFKSEDVHQLIHCMAKSFPGGRLILNASGNSFENHAENMGQAIWR